MATVPLQRSRSSNELADYPTGDGKPVGETPIHRDNLMYNVELIRDHFADDPMVYVSGNMFLYYVEGDKRRHVSPDVFLVRGIPNTYRDAYFTWVEGGKGPDVVIEMTSPSTCDEDLEKKFALYRDVLRVGEYFLFDPKAEYLDPPLQGYRLVDGQYVVIEPVDGRMPSAIMNLRMEAERLDRENSFLRFLDPATGRWLPLPQEVRREYEQAKAAYAQTQTAYAQTQTAYAQTQTAYAQAQAALRKRDATLRKRNAAIRQQHTALREQEAALHERDAELLQAEAERQRIALAYEHAEAERQRLLAELDALRRQGPTTRE